MWYQFLFTSSRVSIQTICYLLIHLNILHATNKCSGIQARYVIKLRNKADQLASLMTAKSVEFCFPGNVFGCKLKPKQLPVVMPDVDKLIAALGTTTVIVCGVKLSTCLSRRMLMFIVCHCSRAES